MAERDLRAQLTAYGPAGVVAAVFAFMLWVRTRTADVFVSEESVSYSGNDPWYHARIVKYAVRNFPSTPNFDPWTNFPLGTGPNTGFGGLFDQLIALAALIVGLGSPSDHLVSVVTAYAPAVFGALTIIPVYFIAKRLTNRWAALIPVVFLALANGQFLTRTLVGVADHQSAEAFFGATAMAGFIYAIETVQLEQPTVADLQDRNWRLLRRPLVASVVGGVALGAYLMMWPPGVMLVATVGLFVVLQQIRLAFRGEPLEYLTLGVAGVMAVATVLTLLYANSYTLDSSNFTLLQPLVTLGVGAGAVAVWQMDGWRSANGYEARALPAMVAGTAILGLALMSVLYPEGLTQLRSLFVRVYSFGFFSSPTSRTVAEIRPATIADAWRAFSGLFPIALLGLAWMGLRVYRENRPSELLVVLWSLTMLSAYFTMIRFGYYLAVNVALLAGVAIWWVFEYVELPSIRTPDQVQTYQIIVVLIVLVAVIPGSVVAVGNQQPVWSTADRMGGANAAWQNELSWMNENTPPVPMEYYGSFERPPDRDFQYPEGAYGVISWWDYGHWITYTAERIPDANPFQQGATAASAYLLADNETRGNLMLEAMPSGETRARLAELSNEELRATIDAQTPQQAAEDTRYVMIDDQMAAGKFSAIATWSGPGPGTYFDRQEFQVGGTTAPLIGPNDRYHGTMLARLYFQDAAGLSHYRLVHETESTSTIVSIARRTPNGWTSDINGDGRAGDFVNRRLTSSVFAAVQQNPSLTFYDVRPSTATVKTYERVPGATLTGQVDTDAPTTVWATVQLRTNTGRNFTYVQQVSTDAEGNFEATVPYATTNSVGPADGGTDAGVTASGPYVLYVGSPTNPSARGEAAVPEPAIYDAETIEVSFEPLADSSGNETNSTSSSLGAPAPPDPTASIDGAGGDPGGIDATGALAVEPRVAPDG